MQFFDHEGVKLIQFDLCVGKILSFSVLGPEGRVIEVTDCQLNSKWRRYLCGRVNY